MCGGWLWGILYIKIDTILISGWKIENPWHADKWKSLWICEKGEGESVWQISWSIDYRSRCWVARAIDPLHLIIHDCFSLVYLQAGSFPDLSQWPRVLAMNLGLSCPWNGNNTKRIFCASTGTSVVDLRWYLGRSAILSLRASAAMTSCTVLTLRSRSCATRRDVTGPLWSVDALVFLIVERVPLARARTWSH